jgi:N-acetyl-anhydromuramyl-L-alanine amidase AmpD
MDPQENTVPAPTPEGLYLNPTILHELTDRSLDVVEYVVIHHTADTDMNKDIAEIAREEVGSMGFLTVGYHAVIHANGVVQFGRPIGKVPAANLGMNTVSYAISLEGNFEEGDKGYIGEKPTEAQIQSAIHLIELVKGRLPNLKFLIGHRDVDRIMDGHGAYATACPGNLLYARLHDLRLATKLLPK